MCGRYTLRTKLNQLLELYALDAVVDWRPRYNIAPTQQVVAVRNGESEREMALLRWGLVPSWADDLKIGARMINARGETVATKPSFRSAFKRRRCLIIADGFYEWKKFSDHKVPFYIRMEDERPIAFAGLWERWNKSDSPVESCTIITTTPNDLMSDLHDRMPVILSGDDADLWLDPEVDDAEVLQQLLIPYPNDDLTAFPVSTLVNSPKNDSEDCLTPNEVT